MSEMQAIPTTWPDGFGEFLTAVNCLAKGGSDTPTIGFLICKNKKKVVPDNALSDETRPMDNADNSLLKSFLADLPHSMPCIKHELAGDGTLTEDESQ